MMEAPYSRLDSDGCGPQLKARVEWTLGPSERVVSFLTQHLGASFCCDCISQKCSIVELGAVESITATLELFPEYLRVVGDCSHCGRSGLLVIHAA